MPTYRALHEVLAVVSDLTDTEEPEFLASWLSNDEVRPREVRAIASRTARRLRDRMEAAGLTGTAADPAGFMRQLYGPLSDSSHARRKAVPLLNAARDRGVADVINVSSIGGKPVFPHYAIYDATKLG